MSIVEKMARAIFDHWQFQGRMAGTMAGSNPVKWIEGGNSFKQEESRDYASAALTATGLTEAQLEGLANGTHVVVPVDATDAMTNAASDAAYDHFSVDDDYGPWLSSAGFAAAYRAMLAAKEGS